jgi:molybdopterin converting factor small subunit
MINVRVNFFGVLKNYTGIEFVELQLEEPATIESALIKLTNKITGFEKLYKKGNIENESDLLIVLNKKEIGVLNGLRTFVKNNDIIFLIPTIHGGLNDP